MGFWQSSSSVLSRLLAFWHFHWWRNLTTNISMHSLSLWPLAHCSRTLLSNYFLSYVSVVPSLYSLESLLKQNDTPRLSNLPSCPPIGMNMGEKDRMDQQKVSYEFLSCSGKWPPWSSVSGDFVLHWRDSRHSIKHRMSSTQLNCWFICWCIGNPKR